MDELRGEGETRREDGGERKTCTPHLIYGPNAQLL